MGRILSSYIFPHPPIIVPEVGKGSESGATLTLDAVKKAAADIRNDGPTTVVITTPHGPVFQDYIYMSVSERLEGDLSRFGAGNVRLSFTNNIPLVTRISELANREGVFAGGLEDSLVRKYKISRELDHGALVPLYFVNNEYDGFRLVHISIAGLPFRDLYKFGMCINRAIRESDEKVVFVASGDLSHKLSPDAPYGYSEQGKVFDEMLVGSVKTLDVESLMEIDENICESAGECGLRSFLMMFGALDGYDLQSQVYSYEGPFGVGYSVSRISVGNENPGKKLFDRMEQKDLEKMNEIRSKEDLYVALARKSLEAYVKNEKIIDIPAGLPSEMSENRAGTFVSLKKHGQLRGCIGTTAPTRKNIAEEIIYNAVSSGTQDPRFDPVEPEELDKLVYSVDVLGESESIQSIDELDVIRYGVIVRSGRRSGLLLPNLEGVDTPEKQVSIALQKAGIRADESYSMERFEVIRHK